MDRLDVIDLKKEYEGKLLLDGVNFHVESGETLCLLGSSGSGKSTILRIIAGIESPDGGRVLWQGQDLNPVPVYRRNFGLMFQDYALFPHLSVAENVAFGLRMQRYSRREVGLRVREALEMVNMGSFADRRVTDLSGGEQQRIALARALAPAPRLLMLDEPLAALDRNLRVELQEELRSLLHSTGIPAIYVTHDQEEAITLGDRLALLHDGRIVQSGTTEDVYHYPTSSWAAQFLGMNGILAGTVSRTDPLTVTTECGTLHPKVVPAGQIPTIGSSITLLVKTARIKVEETDLPTDNLTGLVEESRFLGDHYRVRITLCSGSTLELVVAEALPLREQVLLQLLPGDLLLLPE